MEQHFDDREGSVEKADQRQHCPHHRCNAKRFDGKIGKPVKPEREQLFHRIAGAAHLPGTVVDRHICNILCGTQKKTDDIRIGGLVANHLIHQKALHCKITADLQLLRLAKHDSGHFLIHRTAKISEETLALMRIAGIHGIIPFFQLLKEFPHFRSRRLSVVVQTNHEIGIRRNITKPCHQSGMLTEIPGKVNSRYIFLLLYQRFYDRKRLIGGSIIDQDDFIPVFFLQFALIHRVIDLVDDRRKRLFRAIARNHKTDFFFHYAPSMVASPAEASHRKRRDGIAEAISPGRFRF